MAIDQVDRTVATQAPAPLAEQETVPQVPPASSSHDDLDAGQEMTAQELLNDVGTTAPADDLETARSSAAQRVSGAVRIARTGVVTLAERAPGVLRATGAGVQGTTSALQRLPDSTLRWLAAGSVGLAAGLRLARAPRLVRVVGTAPALLMGAAIVLRRTEPAAPDREDAGEPTGEPTGGTTEMTDEHTKGAISKATGTLEEGLGTLTGDKERQVHGKAKQVQGDAQEALGDIQVAVAEAKHQEKKGA
jgi:uncharacterized protein YjbJ (UPF0337 family)